MTVTDYNENDHHSCYQPNILLMNDERNYCRNIYSFLEYEIFTWLN